MIFPSLACCACEPIPTGPFDVYGQMDFVEERSVMPPDPAARWRYVSAATTTNQLSTVTATQYTQFLVRSMSRGHVNTDSTWADWWVDFSNGTVEDLAVHTLVATCPDYDNDRDIVWIVREGNRDRPGSGTVVEHFIDRNPANWTYGTHARYVSATHAIEAKTAHQFVTATIPMTAPLESRQLYDFRLLVEYRDEPLIRIKFINFRDSGPDLEFMYELSPLIAGTDEINSSQYTIDPGMAFTLNWLRRPDGKLLITIAVTPFATGSRLSAAAIQLTIAQDPSKVGKGTLIHDAQMTKWVTNTVPEFVCVDASTKSILGRFSIPSDARTTTFSHSPAGDTIPYWPPNSAFAANWSQGLGGGGVLNAAHPFQSICCGVNGISFTGTPFASGVNSLNRNIGTNMLFSFDRAGTETLVWAKAPAGSGAVASVVNASQVLTALVINQSPTHNFSIYTTIFPRRNHPNAFFAGVHTDRKAYPIINDTTFADVPFLGTSLVTRTGGFRIVHGTLTTEDVPVESRAYYAFGNIGAMGRVRQNGTVRTVKIADGSTTLVDISRSVDVPSSSPSLSPDAISGDLLLADSDGSDTIIYIVKVEKEFGTPAETPGTVNGTPVTFYSYPPQTSVTTTYQVLVNGTVVWEHAQSGRFTQGINGDLGYITSVRAFRDANGDAMFAFVERRYDNYPVIAPTGTVSTGSRPSGAKQRLHVYRGTTEEWTLDETVYATAEPAPFSYRQCIEVSSTHIYVSHFALCDERIWAKGPPAVRTQISPDNAISLDGTRSWPVSRFGPWVKRDINSLVGDEEAWPRPVQFDTIFFNRQFNDAPSKVLYDGAVCIEASAIPVENFDELDRWYQGYRDGDETSIEPNFW